MIINKCNHGWKKHTDARCQIDVGAIPAYYMCEKCRTMMTSAEVFQLEALENQKIISILSILLSVIATIVSVAAFWR